MLQSLHLAQVTDFLSQEAGSTFPQERFVLLALRSRTHQHRQCYTVAKEPIYLACIGQRLFSRSINIE